MVSDTNSGWQVYLNMLMVSDVRFSPLGGRVLKGQYFSLSHCVVSPSRFFSIPVTSIYIGHGQNGLGE